MKKNIAKKVAALIDQDAPAGGSVSCCGFTVKFGDIVRVKSFAFTYPSGGTGLSHWEKDKFEGVAELVVVNAWHDYETGIRMWAIPYDPKTKKWLEAHSEKTTRDSFFKEPTVVAYVSQFDVV